MTLAILAIAGCKTAKPPVQSDSGAPVVASAPLPMPQAPPTLKAAPYDNAFLLASGHVLLASKTAVRDWDPFGPIPLREVSLGKPGKVNAKIWAREGGHRFVLVNTDGVDHFHIELWDADQLTLIKVLGQYDAEDYPVLDFSNDGSRFVILGCTPAVSKTRTCEVGLYDLTSGERILRKKFPRLPIDEDDRIDARLSPAGTYFALSGNAFQTVVYDSIGKDVFRHVDKPELQIDNPGIQPVPYAFIDDHRILTASSMVLRLTDLAAGHDKTWALGGSDGGLNPSDEPSLDIQVVPANDRAVVRTDLPGDPARHSFFAFDDGSRHDVTNTPIEVCPHGCPETWSGPRELTLSTFSGDTKLQFRIDAVKGIGVTEPYRAPPPFLAFGMAPVTGDFDPYGTTTWHQENRSGGALVSPKGIRFDLATVDMKNRMTAYGDRFFLFDLHDLRLFASDGRSAALTSK